MESRLSIVVQAATEMVFALHDATGAGTDLIKSRMPWDETARSMFGEARVLFAFAQAIITVARR